MNILEQIQEQIEIRKAIISHDDKLEYFKREIVKILEKQAESENKSISKSIDFLAFLYVEKSALGVGHVSTYKDGSMWKKIQSNPPKWKCIRHGKNFSSETSGAKQAITKLINRVKSCNSTDELLDIVLFNIDRFRDEKGQILPIVEKLKTEVDGKKKILNAGKPSTKEQIERIVSNRDKALKVLSFPPSPIKNIEYTRENYNKLFPRGECQTPIGKVKLGDNQFERLDIKDGGARSRFLGAMYQTLTDPICVIEDYDNRGRKSKLFIGYFKDENGNKGFFSVVPNFDGTDVQVSFGVRKMNKIEFKIKRASSFFYVKESGRHTTEPAEPLPVFQNIPQSANSVKYATDVCKSIDELKNYARDKYNLDVTVLNRVPLEQCLKSFVEIEKMTETFKELPKFIQKIRYSKQGEKWAGLYDSTSMGNYCLHIGNIEQIKKDVGETVRPYVRGDDIESVTKHECTHAISEMLSRKYAETFGIKSFDEAFEDWFNNSKEQKAQHYRSRYGTFENFKEEGNEGNPYSVHSSYSIAEQYVRIKYHENSNNIVNKAIIDEALKSLGIDGKRKSKRSEYPSEDELKKYPSLSAMWDISRYAMVNDAECIAEGVADYLTNGEKAQKLSKAIYDTLLKAISGTVKFISKSAIIFKGRLYINKSMLAEFREVL